MESGAFRLCLLRAVTEAWPVQDRLLFDFSLAVSRSPTLRLIKIQFTCCVHYYPPLLSKPTHPHFPSRMFCFILRNHLMIFFSQFFFLCPMCTLCTHSRPSIALPCAVGCLSGQMRAITSEWVVLSELLIFTLYFHTFYTLVVIFIVYC